MHSFSTTALNDGRTTRMASSPGDFDGVVDLALTSSSETTSAIRDVLGEQDRDHEPCIMLQPKGKMITQARPRQAFEYKARSKGPYSTGCAK